MRYGFGAVDVLFELHRRHQDGGMCVVGGCDNQGVEVVCFFVQHLAPVVVACGFWVGFECGGGEFVVQVAQGGDVFAPAVAEVGSAHASYAYCGDF